MCSFIGSFLDGLPNKVPCEYMMMFVLYTYAREKLLHIFSVVELIRNFFLQEGKPYKDEHFVIFKKQNFTWKQQEWELPANVQSLTQNAAIFRLLVSLFAADFEDPRDARQLPQQLDNVKEKTFLWRDKINADSGRVAISEHLGTFCESISISAWERIQSPVFSSWAASSARKCASPACESKKKRRKSVTMWKKLANAWTEYFLVWHESGVLSINVILLSAGYGPPTSHPFARHCKLMRGWLTVRGSSSRLITLARLRLLGQTWRIHKNRIFDKMLPLLALV